MNVWLGWYGGQQVPHIGTVQVIETSIRYDEREKNVCQYFFWSFSQFLQQWKNGKNGKKTYFRNIWALFGGYSMFNTCELTDFVLLLLLLLLLLVVDDVDVVDDFEMGGFMVNCSIRFNKWSRTWWRSWLVSSIALISSFNVLNFNLQGEKKKWKFCMWQKKVVNKKKIQSSFLSQSIKPTNQATLIIHTYLSLCKTNSNILIRRNKSNWILSCDLRQLSK